MRIITRASLAFWLLILLAKASGAAGFLSGEVSMLAVTAPAAAQGWRVIPLLTVGEVDATGAALQHRLFGYSLPGVPDGIGAFKVTDERVRILLNHELRSERGAPYRLANGTSLAGARISTIELDRRSRRVLAVGLAYQTVVDRYGQPVTAAQQLNEGHDRGGLDRLCSANGVAREAGPFDRDVFLTGEEVVEFGDTPVAGMGGQAIALDVATQIAYVAPMLGRASFENLALVDPGHGDLVGLLIGDDRDAAPLYLYLGRKGAAPAAGAYRPPEFLQRNGLGLGRLYVWVADDDCTAATPPAARNPQQFQGTGGRLSGRFCAIDHFDPRRAGQPHYDRAGFASLARQDAMVAALGGFRFGRPEDVATDPDNARRVAMATAGEGSDYPGENWGTLYLIDLDDSISENPARFPEAIPASLTILYDGDDAGGGQFAHPDLGIRNPDNLDWAGNGRIYINEDRATGLRRPKHPAGCDRARNPQLCRQKAFGGVSGAEASVWELDPRTGQATRLLEMVRQAVPRGQRDTDSQDLGDWESSGVLDVSPLLGRDGGETVLLVTVQAHSLAGAALGSARRPPVRDAAQKRALVEGGQLLLMIKRVEPTGQR